MEKEYGVQVNDFIQTEMLTYNILVDKYIKHI